MLYRNVEPPGHVHIHFVPRYQGDPPAVEPGSPLVPADAAAAFGGTVDRLAVVSHIANEVRIDDPDRFSPMVRSAIAVLRRWGSITPYRLWPFTMIPPPAKGEVYVSAWMVLLALLVSVGSGLGWTGPVAIVSSLVAAVRFQDIMVTHLRTILDRRASILASARRSVLLLGLNLVELWIIGAIWLGAITRAALSVLLFDASAAVSQTSANLAWLAQTAALATSVATFVLLAIGLGNVLGLVAAGFREAASVDPD